MAKNRSFTGGRRSVGTPTLGKEAYFQLIRKIRNANKKEAPLPDVGDRESGAMEKELINHNTEKELMQMDKKTQMKRLLELFRTTPTLTVQVIIEKLKINSPRKVISDLRAKGVPIKDRYIEEIDRYGQTIRFKEYWIEKAWWDGNHVL